jgi:hypothetical protein
MRRTAVLLVLVALGCTSTWQKHQEMLAQHMESGDWDHATSEARWLVDNSFVHAPHDQRSPQAEADRNLRLADMATRAGNAKQAIEALRQALILDPSCAPSVQKKIDRLPLTSDQMQRVRSEFAWNMAALTLDDADLIEHQREQGRCWSYRVREIRVRHNLMQKTSDGKERQVRYDARSWSFDAQAGAWHPDGNWMIDVGTESEAVEGPQSPRYRAIIAADHGFYVDGRVPACHRDAWSGPYDTDGTVFVAARLPAMDNRQ